MFPESPICNKPSHLIEFRPLEVPEYFIFNRKTETPDKPWSHNNRLDHYPQTRSSFTT